MGTSAYADEDCEEITASFGKWLDALQINVIEDEFGYEPGEFTVYPSHWAPLYEDGLTPRQAWQRALDGFAEQRRADDAARRANWERIQREDAALRAPSEKEG